jgi:signal transduction histidine kinase
MADAHDSTSLPRAKILLVDDQPANLLALKAILQDLGHNLVEARSGEEALRHLLREDFAVILLDVVMPGVDGYETARLVRGRDRSRYTPIIFLTAYDSTDLRVAQAYELGAVDYLVKPLVPVILRAKVTGFVELFQKTEEVKRQGERLRRTADELARSNRELEQFAYVASHDLKEPLRKITIYLQLLERRYRDRLDADARQYLGHAVDAAGYMQTLVNDLLAYARLGSRPRPLERTDCAAVFDQALANLAAAVQETKADVSRTALPAVPGDASQLVQLFQNLLDNALKFRQPGQAPVVRVDARRDGDDWLFAVRDKGIGIDSRYAERIFVLFERLHGKGEYPGTGIGLAICKKIVEQHGGRIWVESQPGSGATFWFTLPAPGDQSP